MSSEEHRSVELLEEIAKWTKFEAIQTAHRVLTENITKDAEKLAYYYSDGRGSVDVAKLSGVSDFAVRSYWKKWAAVGLVTPSTKFKGRYVRIFSLEDLGIEVPSKRPKPQSEQSTETSKEESQ